MFCPNCGVKIERDFQKFCHMCGYNLLEIYQSPQKNVQDYKYAPNIIESPKPAYSASSISPPKANYKNIPGPHSKKCLGFGIPSLIIGVVAFFVGYNGFTIAQQLSMYGYYTSVGMVFWPTILVVHVIGLTFGIVSRINSSLAGKMEPINDVEKAGSTLAGFGITINAILIFAVIYVLIFFPI
jgi:hypothetical protein